MIFFNQFKVPTVTFGKCFAPIALLKEFGSLVTIIEDVNMQRCSGKANKVRYIHHKRDAEGHRHQGTEY